MIFGQYYTTIVNFPYSAPFVCGLYYGPGKPNDFNEFLRRFIEEAHYLEIEGFHFQGKHLEFEVSAFICDSPAVSSVKGTVSHTGYWSCNRCLTKGMRIANRTVFPELEAEKRTDHSFRSREQREHHRIITQLEVENLKLNMIYGFPKESLHLLDLGVMKRYLQFLIGNENSPARLKKKEVDEISKRLNKMRGHIPVEFSREPRGLEEMSRWKGTELHLFRDYLSICVFKNVLSESTYEHFLNFHVAVRLLSRHSSCQIDGIYPWCNSLLKNFVKQSAKILGPHFISSNVHYLIHLVDDVENFGPLPSWSGYWAENYLQMVKSLVKSKRSMLEQAVKRLHEIDKHLTKVKKSTNVNNVFKEHTEGPLCQGVVGKQYSKFTWGHFELHTKAPNNIVFLKNDQVLYIMNIVRNENNDIFLIGHLYQRYDDYFINPVVSRAIGTVLVKDEYLSPLLSVQPLANVKHKGMKLPSFSDEKNDSWVISPMSFDFESKLL